MSSPLLEIYSNFSILGNFSLFRRCQPCFAPFLALSAIFFSGIKPHGFFSLRCHSINSLFFVHGKKHSITHAQTDTRNLPPPEQDRCTNSGFTILAIFVPFLGGKPNYFTELVPCLWNQTNIVSKKAAYWPAGGGSDNPGF